MENFSSSAAVSTVHTLRIWIIGIMSMRLRITGRTLSMMSFFSFSGRGSEKVERDPERFACGMDFYSFPQWKVELNSEQPSFLGIWHVRVRINLCHEISESFVGFSSLPYYDDIEFRMRSGNKRDWVFASNPTIKQLMSIRRILCFTDGFLSLGWKSDERWIRQGKSKTVRHQ